MYVVLISFLIHFKVNLGAMCEFQVRSNNISQHWSLENGFSTCKPYTPALTLTTLILSICLADII